MCKLYLLEGSEKQRDEIIFVPIVYLCPTLLLLVADETLLQNKHKLYILRLLPGVKTQNQHPTLSLDIFHGFTREHRCLKKFCHTGQIDIMVSYWNIMDPLYNAKSIFRYFPGPVLSKFWLKLFLLYNTCFLPWCQNFLEYNGQHTGNESAFRMLGIKHFNVINSNLNHEKFAVK